MCHEASQVDRLRSYHEDLRKALPDLESALRGARKALPASELPEPRKAAIAKELDNIQSDLEYLKTGDDIHNIHYAAKLERALQQHLSKLCRELKAPEPKVSLPPLDLPPQSAG